MTQGRKTGGKDWKSGESGNPSGRIPLPQEIRQAKAMTAVEVEAKLTEYLQLSEADLVAKLTSPQATMLEKIIGSIVFKAIETGCSMRLNFLFDRIIGKVKDKVEITMPTPFILRKRDGEEIVMGIKKDEET